MWLLASPWALIALASVPLVLGIYFFRTRSRRREVSSLFLWLDRSRPQQGGRRIETLQFPLLLFLESLVLVLLAVGASGPNVRATVFGRPAVFILDGSYSMTAVGSDGKTPRQRAMEELERIFVTSDAWPVEFLVAGVRPEMLGQRARSPAEARKIIRDWQCTAAVDSIDAAMSFAATVASPEARIGVFTDRAPAREMTSGRLRWHALGEPLPNTAIVHASRGFQGEKDRLLVETLNESDEIRRLHLTVRDVDRGTILYEKNEMLGPWKQQRLRSTIPAGVGAVEVRLIEDALDVDNRMTLLPPTRPAIRVAVHAIPDELRSKLARAVEASGLGHIVEERPELLITGTETETSEPAAKNATSRNARPWVWYIAGGKEKIQAFIGPFILDRSLPLAAGLGLDGVVWAAPEEIVLAGTPVVSAGDVPLLTEQSLRHGGKRFEMAFVDQLSTLTSHPVWPALIWNMLKYRSDLLGGVVNPNTRLGSEVVYVAREGVDSITLRHPNGTEKKLPVRGGRVSMEANACGVYTITPDTSDVGERFSVGALSKEESDLTRSGSGVFGNWMNEEMLQTDYRSIAWAFLLGSLLLLAAHLLLVGTMHQREDIASAVRR